MKKGLLTIIAIGFTFAAGPIIAAGDIAAGKDKSAECAACHGVDGNSTEPSFPKLAGQAESYLYKQLMDFTSGARESLIMASLVKGLTPQDIADISAYYASMKVKPGSVSKTFLAQGQKLYRGGNKETGVPACMACHGPNGAGMPAAKWPALSGQHAQYTETQLEAFTSGDRSNDPNKMMRDIAARLSADERQAVSAYISGLH